MPNKELVYIQKLSFIISIILFIINAILLFSGNGKLLFVIINYISFIISLLVGLIYIIKHKDLIRKINIIMILFTLLFLIISSLFIITNLKGENNHTCDNVMSCDDELDKDGNQTCYYCKDMYDDECLEKIKCPKEK